MTGWLDLNNRNLFSHISGGWKLDIKLLAYLVSSEVSLPADGRLLLAFTGSSLCVCVLSSSFIRTQPHWMRAVCCAKSLSCVWLFATPWTVTRQAPLSTGILQARILSCPSPGDLPIPGIKPRSSTLQTFFFLASWFTREAPSSGQILTYLWASLVVQRVKNLPAKETQVWSLGQEDPLEQKKATHCSILAWEILWQRNLAGYGPCSRKEVDMTERPSACAQACAWTHTHTHTHTLTVEHGLTMDKYLTS